MKITDHIKNAKGKTLFSFEVVPPKKGNNIEELYRNIDPLMEFNPPFIDVTTSREEYYYIEHPNGLLEKKVTRMRPGTVGICAAIQHKYKVDTVPHVLCGGFSKEETEYLLVDCLYLGIDNVMALRGDAMKEQRYFQPTEGGHTYATELVTQISNLNKGIYLNGIAADHKANFCIGVAGYPDNQKYFEFVDKAREAGINVPIIPGIKPIAVKKHLNLLSQAFKIDFPQELVEAVEACKHNADVKQIGIEWAIQQSKELKAAGVPVLHYYSMGKSDNIVKVISEVF